jgi:hypothetical protein
VRAGNALLRSGALGAPGIHGLIEQDRTPVPSPTHSVDNALRAGGHSDDDISAGVNQIAGLNPELGNHVVTGIQWKTTNLGELQVEFGFIELGALIFGAANRRVRYRCCVGTPCAGGKERQLQKPRQ